ncbi:hypothetical protein [Actinomadura rubrisoli]|uniref:hypothetical protein n=1 Tax=Actinomadura rubrisoli TaxID=2530368 RepID=UPI001FB7F1DD|nr:hypothetical protein [Actinomadura rubrisoli]
MPLPRRRGARRRRHREAVFGPPPPVPSGLPERSAGPLSAVTGTILDASPHLLVLRSGGSGGTEVRIAMTEATAVWHGGRAGLAALRPGREVIVRPKDDGPGAARVWVDIGRITGTILARGRDTVEVDMGPHRGRAHVVIPPPALGRVLVRHPRLEAGYLIDVIYVGSPGGPQAVRPGTSQPGYRADDLAAPGASAPVHGTLHGTATWFGPIGGATTPPPPSAPRGGLYEGTWPYVPDAGPMPAAPDSDEHGDTGWEDEVVSQGGAAYPAIDPEGDAGGCPDAPPGCVALPYLSLGSEVTVHNECSGRTVVLPVVECGCMAARYCDRCVECGTSPRGRIVELTPTAFVALGGDLEAGCFNALVRPAAPGASDEGSAGRW